MSGAALTLRARHIAQRIFQHCAPMFCKLPDRVFFRRYGEIGYLYNQVSQTELVLDASGAAFLEQLRKEPQPVSAIAERVSATFIDGDKTQVNVDLLELLSLLRDDGFVLLAATHDAFKALEPCFSYARNAPEARISNLTEEDHVPSSDYLTQHFATHPTLFGFQFELTSFCNLRCIHCYLGENHPAGGMPKAMVLRLLDELRDMGTLKVAFSGGEVMARSDLEEILRHARKNDFCITLLTNNTLMTDQLLETICSTDVALVQVSLYSLDHDVHDSITGKRGSLRATLANLDKLATRNIPVLIACPVMKQNLLTFDRVIDWGVKRGFRVKPDVMLMARSDFSTGNLRNRLDMDESRQAIDRMIAADPIYRESLRKKDALLRPLNPNDPVCGIGRSTMCISAEGDFFPCSGLKLKLGSFHTTSVREVWNTSSAIRQLRGITKSSYGKCLTCASLDFCHLCPAKFFNESGGDIFGVSDYFCSVAALNRERAEAFISEQANR